MEARYRPDRVGAGARGLMTGVVSSAMASISFGARCW